MTDRMRTGQESRAAKRRKHHVKADQEAIYVFVVETGIVTVSEAADRFDVSPASARRKLDGLVSQGRLIRDEYDDQGVPAGHLNYRYGVPA